MATIDLRDLRRELWFWRVLYSLSALAIWGALAI